MHLESPLEQGRPTFIGERASVTGSRSFRRLIAAREYEQAAVFACAQLDDGATMLDLSTAGGTVDERDAMARLIEAVRAHTSAPLVIDSTDPDVITAVLPRCGRAIVNSIRVDMDPACLARIVDAAQTSNAAIVVSCFDSSGPAASAESALAVATQAVELLTRAFDVSLSDIIIDPHAFPATGDTLPGRARNTVDAIRLITNQLGTATVIGISNGSWGMAHDRWLIDSVFLDLATAAGLTHAIVDPRRIRAIAAIEPDATKAALALLNADTEDARRAAKSSAVRSHLTTASLG